MSSPISGAAAAAVTNQVPSAPATQVGKMQNHVVIEGGGKTPVTINQQGVTILQNQATSRTEAKEQLKSLGEQIESGKRTLEAIKLTRQMVAEFRMTGKHPSNVSHLPEHLQKDVMKLYSYATTKLEPTGQDKGDHDVTKELGDLTKTQQKYVASLEAGQKEVTGRLGELEARKTRKAAEKAAEEERKTLRATRRQARTTAKLHKAGSDSSSEPNSASSASSAASTDSTSEKTGEPSAAAAPAEKKPPQAMTRETVAKSASFAREYLAQPENKFFGEKGILNQLEEGGMVKLSRRKIKEMTGQNIPHSVMVMKNSNAPGGYQLFFKQHSKDIETGEAFEQKKTLGKGTFNVAIKSQSEEGADTVHRHPEKVKGQAPQKGTDDIAEDKVMDAMRGKSNFVMTPIAVGQENVALQGTAFKPATGAMMERFAGDGDKFTEMDAKKLVMAKPPTPAQALSMIDSLSHGYADLHANHIAQRDCKFGNTGVFIDPSNPDKPIMKLHDFGKASNIAEPTKKGDKSEVDMIEIAGTVLTMSPEQANGGTAAQQAQLKELQKQRDAATTDADRAAIEDKINEHMEKVYSQMDCYAMSLMSYSLIAGKYPKYLQDINNKFQRAVQVQIQVGRLDIQINPDNEIGRELRTELTNIAKEKGIDPELTELILKGLSTDPDQRPTAKQFQQFFQTHKSTA